MFKGEIDREVRYRWSEEIKKEVKSNNPLFSIVESNNGDDLLQVLCASEKDGTYQKISADAYYEIKKDAAGSSSISYHLYPFVKVLITNNPDEDKFEYYNITEVLHEDDGLIISYMQWGDYSEEVIRKGEYLSFISSNNEDAFPHNTYKDIGVQSGNPDNLIWYEYIGSDIPVMDIKYSKHSIIPSNESFISVSIEMGEELISNINNLYDWEYTIDCGNTWIPYAKKSNLMSYAFEVPKTCTGFAVRVILYDSYGYVSEYTTGQMIYPTSEYINIIPVPILHNIPKIVSGIPYSIKWSPLSINIPIIYVLEEKIGTGDLWKTVYSGTNTEFNAVVTQQLKSIQYRLKAESIEVDSSSEYVYSDEYTIESNHPPIISGEDIDIGLIDSFNEAYTIYDEMDSVVDVMEYVDDIELASKQNIPTKYTQILNIAKNIWNKLVDGRHIARVVAIDSNGESSERLWIFKKSSLVNFKVNTMPALLKTYTTEYHKLFQRQEDGTYVQIMYENDTENILHNDKSLNEVLDAFLPETLASDVMPSKIDKGKIIIGNTKIWIGGASGSVIELSRRIGGHVAQKSAPSDKSLLWVDTSDSTSPLLRFYNNGKWEYIKSVYSGGNK